MENRPIFFDPRGRRRAIFPRVATVLVAVAALVSVAFFMTLLAVPSLRAQDPARHRNGFLPKAPDSKTANAAVLKSRRELFTEIEQTPTRTPPVVSRESAVVAAFYDPSLETGVTSLRAFGNHITHLIPAWLHLTPDGSALDTSDFDFSENPHTLDVISAARRAGVRVMPLLSNSGLSGFDAAPVDLLFRSPKSEQNLANAIRDWLVLYDFQGLNIDFEDLSDVDQHLEPEFLRILATTFRDSGLELTVDIESADTSDPETLRELVAPCEWGVMMAYDYHWETSKAGPIAPLDWAENVLDRALQAVPPDKLVLGIGNYAYDWSPGVPTGQLTYQEALATAVGYREGEKPQDVINFDPESLNANFQYVDDETHKQHEVWMLDAASAYNQWLGARNRQIRGMSMWALGEEDPGIWKFLNRATAESEAAPSVAPMRTVEFPYGVDQMGIGEILRVLQRPAEGIRTFDVDEKSGLITDMQYHAYPFPYVIQHSGYVPKALALTFDDGPDGRYTPQVLDELKKLGVKATFFEIGRNAESFPGLVRREYDEGHEIGNHTFNHPDLSTVTTERATLEINATQRAIQSITGHSTVLFRPPYNADSEPSTEAEVGPVVLADRMGYVTIGEKIDPTDWDLEIKESGGSKRPKTALDIARLVIDGVHDMARKNQEGNIILLHDAGGPRDATVASLALFVPELQREGYRFVLVSDMMRRSRDGIEPPISARDRVTIWFDGLVFWGIFAGDSLLALAFITAICLGLARFLFVAPLALGHRHKHSQWTHDPAYAPTVSGLIAAYNEERVIVRTITSILESHYPIKEVIVINDGSKDGTANAVSAAFGDDPRVRLVTQENGGKASALNHAFELCDSEIALCVDADTQLHHEAVERLVRHFVNPHVGAVAGNVRVGNAVNVLTKWQALEYTTSQNLDRRAYAALNSITVVPGAIGAWRRSAVLAVGAFEHDTLAEDMDLTWRLRRAGYRQENEAYALAFTEAPDTFRGFFRQRFRWAYGTLQCLVKHRRALFHYGWFGWLALPTMWLFQVVFQGLAPLIDLQVLYTLTGWVAAEQSVRQASSQGVSSESSTIQLNGATTSLTQVLVLYFLFFAVELIAGLLAYRLEDEKPTALWWLFLQRFAYRQVMYGVVYKSIVRALVGSREVWGVVERKGTVDRASAP
jgi:cellulose synthase/poly-beta-1,6-N-acetylglucosamine synthase-like glycosyltransferase/peptidoglycan/xylan/chitin deacetylase (PgdA/CDA1 family)/spore germination protein YaaH